MALNGEKGWICLTTCNADSKNYMLYPTHGKHPTYRLSVLFTVLVLQWVSSVERDSGTTFSHTNQSQKTGSPHSPHADVAAMCSSLQLSIQAASTRNNEADRVDIQGSQAVTTNLDIGKASQPSETEVAVDSDGEDSRISWSRHNTSSDTRGQEKSTDNTTTHIEKLPV